MDQYETNGWQGEDITNQPASPSQATPPQDPVTYQAPPSDPHSYRGAGAGRRESPYANSPYVMNHPPRQESAPHYNTGYQQPQAPRPKHTLPKKKSGFWKGAVSLLLSVALVAGGCMITAASVNSYWEERNALTVRQLTEQIQNLEKQISAVSNASTGMTASGTPVYSAEGLSPSQVYAKNVGSVVAISTQTTTNYFGQVSEAATSGSGFILTEDGYVVSNYHVISGASKLTVILHDGTEYDAKLIGGDENNDIALLKVEATGLQAVTVGSSDALVVGDQVVAIGNPLGELTSTQTVGYISAKDRDVTTDGVTINMMQTDAAINPGNSGGPLFNMKGEVVGITTAKYSGTTGSGATIEGIGFAIPIDDVLSMLSDLREYGYVTGAYLGVSVRSMDAEVANAYGLPTGSQVATVEKGSCSDKAGIQEKDIIVKLGQFDIEDNTDLLRALRKFKAGDTTTITVWRSGSYLDLSITLDEKPHEESEPTVPENNVAPPAGRSNDSDVYGGWPDWFFGRGFGG